MVDLIFVSIAELISIAMEGLVDLILPVFDFDFTTFATTFPYAADAFVIFQRVAIGFILLISVAQIFFFFIGKEQNRPSPFRIAISTFAAVGGVYYGNYLLEGIMNIAQLPYEALMNADIKFEIDFSVVVMLVNDVFYMISPLLYIFALLLIGIAFIKLLLEAVERYVVLFALIYLSPLASAALASDATNGIFKRYFTMFLSQCLLLILNVWSLQMTISMFRALPSSDGPLISLFIGYAFLRFASRIDSYLNSLGLNAAVTGAGLGEELIASGMALMSGFSSLGKGGKAFTGGTESSSGAGGGNILGEAANSISSFAGKYSPFAAGAVAAKNGLGVVGTTIGQSINAAKTAAAGVSGFGEKATTGFTAAKESWKKNWSSNMDEGVQANANESLWFRDFGATPYENFESLSDAELRTLSSSGYMADAAFNSIEEGTEICDPRTVSAIASGLGIERFSPYAQEAIHVGNGVIPGENLNYTANENGIHLGYEKNGKVQELDIKNASQYARLSTEEQALYSSMKSPDGTQYYFHQSSDRALSDSQKRQAETNAKLSAFSKNPATPLSPDAVSAMRRDPSHISAAYRNMRESGTRYSASTPEGSLAMQQALSNTPFDSKLSGKMNEAVTRLQNGNFIEGHMDGNGLHMVWENKNGEVERLDTIAPGAQVDTDALASDYLPHAMSNGEISMAKFTAPPSAQERVLENISAFTSNPSTPLSPDAVSAMRRDPSHISVAYRNMRESGTRYSTDTAEGNIALQQMVANTPASGKYSADIQLATAQLRNGNSVNGYSDGSGYEVTWQDSNGNAQYLGYIAPGVNPDPATIDPGYTPIPMDNGETAYILRYDASSPSARDAAIFEKAGNFGTPNAMTTADYGYAQNLGVTKRNEVLNKTFDGLSSREQVVELNESNRQEVADFISMGSWGNISKNQQSQFSSAVAASDLSAVSATISKRGCKVKAEHGTMTVLSSDAISSDGAKVDSQGNPLYEPEYLLDRGYHRNNINGREYWSLFETNKDEKAVVNEVV